ncbi:MAG TPA: hypothetical protein VL172_19190, partial [Kofleriaceae bacterium]|nr:hypothetical protein [Kofleriaceae bacterium]
PWTLLPTATLQYANVPASAGALEVWITNLSQSLPYRTLYANLPLTTSVQQQLPVAAFGEGLQVKTRLSSAAGEQREVWRSRIAAGSGFLLDVGGTRLPWPSAVTYDASTRTLSWTQTTGDPVDGAHVVLRYARSTVNFTWRVLAPPGLTSVRLPTFPGNLASVPPQPEDTVTGDVTVLESSDVDGYAAFRAIMDPDYYTYLYPNAADPEAALVRISGADAY